MRNSFYVLILALLLLLFYYNGSAQSSYSFGAGTIFGGAINNENVENASGEPMFGATLDFGYRIKLNDKLILKPKLSYEFRHFEYSATQRNDTIVTTELMGNTAEIPTYYTANISGKANSGGLTLNSILEYKFIERSSLLFGFYGTYFLFTNDYVDINVRIGEGGLLPDIDSSYNNGINMRNYEYGISLGGKYYISDKFSFSIVGTRALSSVYTISGVKNQKGEEVLFYSTYAKIFFSYYF